MNYRKWLIEDLQNLSKEQFAITHIAEELETLSAEYAAIKATNYDKMPSGSGDNIQEEKLLTNIAKRDELAKNLRATKRHVEDMEKLLAQLDPDELMIIQRTVINKQKFAADEIAAELGYERTQVYRLKTKALAHLAKLRHGVSFQQ